MLYLKLTVFDMRNVVFVYLQVNLISLFQVPHVTLWCYFGGNTLHIQSSLKSATIFWSVIYTIAGI